MKASYLDFLNEHPQCGKSLENDPTAKEVFRLLSKDRNVLAMIDASDAGKPAISAVVLVVEHYCTKHFSSDFDLEVGQRRTVVGCMIRTILLRFGYEPVQPASKTQKDLSKSIGAKYFVSGTCYKYNPHALATMMVVRKAYIEPAVFCVDREMHCPYCKSINNVDLHSKYSAFFDAQSEKERELNINFEHTCIACDERFKVAGYMIVCPPYDIEREEINAVPIETTLEQRAVDDQY